MGICALVDELNSLRKSSAESIDSDKSFNDFKKYMHVGRDVEDDLKKLLRKVNQSQRKTLVLLCGSAGDGKSHMLSYLKNSDEEHLLFCCQKNLELLTMDSESKGVRKR